MACFLTFLLQLVAVFGCLTMADPDALEQNSKFLRTTENRDLLGLSYRGDNPTSRMGRCQGDCDDNNDCEGSLVCFFKDAGDDSPVPGCTGTDTSRTDYCIDADDLNTPPSGSPPTSPNPPPTPNPPPPPTPNPPPPPPTPQSSDIEDFKLKLYWERGYYWQEERRERKWCMRCKGGSCSNGDKLYIERCNRSGVQRFDFVYVNSDEVLIRLHGRNRCLERTGSNIKVRSCDSGDSKQRWLTKRGDFDGDKFEISQDGSNKCITQRHHPKAGEEVELEPCGTARKGDTSYWERCTSSSC